MRDAIRLSTSVVVAQTRQHSADAQGDVGSRINDFIRLEPTVFTGSRTGEDPQDFLVRIARMLRVMHVSDTELVELDAFRLDNLAAG